MFLMRRPYAIFVQAIVDKLFQGRT